MSETLICLGTGVDGETVDGEQAGQDQVCMSDSVVIFQVCTLILAVTFVTQSEQTAVALFSNE